MTTPATRTEHGNTPAGTLFMAFDLSDKTWNPNFAQNLRVSILRK
jgi:hypothetical protein